MAFSAFDRRLLDEGPSFFARPRLANLLETLGSTRAERVAVLTTMLGNSCPEELEEADGLFERRLIRAAQRQLRSETPDRRRQRSRNPQEG